MGLDLDSPCFGIKDHLKDADKSNKDAKDLLIDQLLSLSNQEWFDLRDDFTKNELLGIIVKLLNEIRDLKEFSHDK
jgi:hypothetical protein